MGFRQSDGCLRWLWLGCVALMAALPARAEDPEVALAAIRAGALDTAGARSLTDVTLKPGPARIHLEQGMLYPGTRLGDRVLESIFVGKGSLTLETADPIEQSQLQFFAGAQRLDVTFDELVLVAPDPALAAQLAGEPAGEAAAGSAGKARETFDGWIGSAERKLLGVPTSLFQAAVGSGVYEGYFLAWVRGTDVGDFIYLIDPEAREQITVGRFVPLDATKKERKKILRQLHSQQKQGRLMGVEFGDLGNWDTWFSASMMAGNGTVFPGESLFEPVHYSLEFDVLQEKVHESEINQKKHTSTGGRATIELLTKTFGQRTLELLLDPDLSVDAVRDAAGGDLFFWRELSVITVALPEAHQPNEKFKISVEYSGQALDKAGKREFRLNNTVYWYPHAGNTDLATYDMTFRWPHDLDLVASGSLVDEGRDGNTRWQKRKLDIPTRAVSFEVGQFETITETVGHVEITYAFDRPSKGAMEEIQATVADALTYYEEVFGPYPLDHLTIVSVQRDFSQGLLGFVTLAGSIFKDLDVLDQLLGITDRRIIVAHELAHQWWGNAVTWHGYRDQWISEAMAEYASLLFAKHRLEFGKDSGLSPTARWRDYLLASHEQHNTIESIGPLVLGSRLSSSVVPAGYEIIVYKKGLLVVNMLAEHFGEERFIQMLKRLVDGYRGKAIRTEGLVQALEELSGVKLEAFADQYIFGTGLPEVYYSFAFEPAGDGKWRIQGKAIQQPFYGYSVKVAAREDGTLDIHRSRVDSMDVAESELVLPMAISIFRDDAGGKKRKAGEGNAVMNARLKLQGEETPFNFELPHEPVDLWLDPYGESLVRLYCETREPKRMLYFQGLDHAYAGEVDAASDFFRRALEADMRAEGAKESSRQRWATQYEERMLDAAIQIDLANLLLDHGRDDAADEVISTSFKKMDAVTSVFLRPRLELAQGRLALHRGDTSGAFKKLKRLVTVDGLRTAESYTLLAIAAKAAGENLEACDAGREAEDRGVDIALLE